MRGTIREQLSNTHAYVELGREKWKANGNETPTRILLTVEDNHNDPKTKETNNTNPKHKNTHVDTDWDGATLGMSKNDLTKTKLVSHHRSKDD